METSYSPLKTAAVGEGSDSHCFQARSRSLQKRLLASSCPSVRPSGRVSVRLIQLGSHWTDFR